MEVVQEAFTYPFRRKLILRRNAEYVMVQGNAVLAMAQEYLLLVMPTYVEHVVGLEDVQLVQAADTRADKQCVFGGQRYRNVGSSGHVQDR